MQVLPLFGGLALLAAAAAFALWIRFRVLREREQVAALRAALEACVWENRIRGDESLEATVRDLRKRAHDVNNVLSTALLSTQLFIDASRAVDASPAALADLGAAANGMVDALRQLKAVIDSGRRPETTTRPRSPLIKPVDLLAVLHASVEHVCRRHRRTTLVVHGPPSDAVLARVSVSAGREGLERALVALLENGCAGDGLRRARHVEVRVAVSAEVDVVAVEVSDDGPGFTQTQPGQPIEVFESTKRGSLGLGLYTAERIARASGGSLRRANNEAGGAAVTLFLPVAPEPALAQ
ncbi:MAG: ATP-binding protein [Myxococcota bacterium]